MKINLRKTELAILITSITLLILNITSLKLKTKTGLKTNICNPLCLECSDTDQNYCNVCKVGVFQFNFNCFSKCPDGTYLDEEWQKCRPCDLNCPVCWGPASDMCGTTPGLRTSVVILENEIRDFFNIYTFSKNDINEWINNLKLILKDNSITAVDTQPTSSTLSPADIYNTNKIDVFLPLCSFSKLGGIFLPVPSYFNINGELVPSHWVYHSGMWDGQQWNEQWYPRLPSFLLSRGEKNKIYYENGGFWIYDSHREWFWVKTSIISETDTSVDEVISQLNTIRFDLGEFNSKNLKYNLEMKKVNVENNIKLFFDKFMETDKMIFSELKQTINNEQVNLMSSLNQLKNKVKLYFGEESIALKNKEISPVVPQSDMALRKSGISVTHSNSDIDRLGSSNNHIHIGIGIDRTEGFNGSNHSNHSNNNSADNINKIKNDMNNINNDSHLYHNTVNNPAINNHEHRYSLSSLSNSQEKLEQEKKKEIENLSLLEKRKQYREAELYRKQNMDILERRKKDGTLGLDAYNSNFDRYDGSSRGNSSNNNKNTHKTNDNSRHYSNGSSNEPLYEKLDSAEEKKKIREIDAMQDNSSSFSSSEVHYKPAELQKKTDNLENVVIVKNNMPKTNNSVSNKGIESTNSSTVNVDKNGNKQSKIINKKDVVLNEKPIAVSVALNKLG